MAQGNSNSSPTGNSYPSSSSSTPLCFEKGDISRQLCCIRLHLCHPNHIAEYQHACVLFKGQQHIIADLQRHSVLLILQNKQSTLVMLMAVDATKMTLCKISLSRTTQTMRQNIGSVVDLDGQHNKCFYPIYFVLRRLDFWRHFVGPQLMNKVCYSLISETVLSYRLLNGQMRLLKWTLNS